MRLAPRDRVRVIPDLLHARDEHLGRDTEFPAARGWQVTATERERHDASPPLSQGGHERVTSALGTGGPEAGASGAWRAWKRAPCAVESES